MKLSPRYKMVLNYVVGPLLFAVLSYSIYHRLQARPDGRDAASLLQEALHGPSQWILYAVGALALLNWGIEARKWQILVKPVERISLFTAYKSVLSGLAMGMFVPNRLGEYVGRVFYMKDGNRLQSVAFTAVAGLAQLIVTLFAGVAGLLYLYGFLLRNSALLQGLNEFWFLGFLLAMAVIALAFLLVYYKLSWLTRMIEKVPFVQRYQFFIQHLENFHWVELTRILWLSATRYCVFIVQYLLMLQLFDAVVPTIAGSFMVMVLFLVLAVVPTITLAELGVRGQASLQLFGLLTTNQNGILYAAAGIWLINLIVPAMAGTLFILGLKLFKKRTEE